MQGAQASWRGSQLDLWESKRREVSIPLGINPLLGVKWMNGTHVWFLPKLTNVSCAYLRMVPACLNSPLLSTGPYPTTNTTLKLAVCYRDIVGNCWEVNKTPNMSPATTTRDIP